MLPVHLAEVAMGRERLEQIRKKNWERDARAARNEVRATLEQHLRIELIEFLAKEESERYGAQFWERLRSVDTEFDVGFGEVAQLVTRSTPYPEPTVWLHGRIRETGAILIPSREMWRAGNRNWEQLGPDLMFGAQDLTSGLCFEVQENESVLRFWGSTWGPAEEALARMSP